MRYEVYKINLANNTAKANPHVASLLARPLAFSVPALRNNLAFHAARDSSPPAALLCQT